jgi:Leucine-rich repeat (LRR) protein
MPVSFRCAHCGGEIQVLEIEVGKRIECPACKTAFVLHQDTPGPGQGEEPRPAPAEVEKILVEPEGERSAVPETVPIFKPWKDEPPAERRGEATGGRAVQPSRQMILRGFVLLCGILGTAACGFVATRWQAEQVKAKNEMDVARRLVKAGFSDPLLEAGLNEFDQKGKAYPLLFVAAILGILAGILGFGRLGLVAGLLLLCAVAGPAYFLPKTLLYTGFLLAAGLLGFLIQSPGRARAADRAEHTGKQPSPVLQAVGIVAACIGGLVLLGYSSFVGYSLYKTAGEKEPRLEAEGPKFPNPLDGDSPDRKGFVPDPEPQAKEPVKEIALEAIQDEVERAGAGVKLVKLDLAPAGLNATLDVPEECRLKGFFGDIQILKDSHFYLKIELGRRGLASMKKMMEREPVFVNSGDAAFFQQSWADKPSCAFGLVKVLGHQDFFITNNTWFGGKAVHQDRADCLLMIKCVQTLALKPSPPVEPAEALELFKTVDCQLNNRAGEIQLNDKATDATLALLENNLALRDLDLSQTKITDVGLVHLKGLKNLEKLNVKGRYLTDAALPYLAGLTNLKELNLGENLITDDGLRHLLGLVNLESLDLEGTALPFKVKGPGLAQLAGLKKLNTLRLSNLDLDDEAMVYLKGLTSLNDLDLSLTKVLGPGLAQLKDLPNLKRLNLGFTHINDAGLAGIEGLVNLEELSLPSTNVVGEGLQHLKGFKKLKTLDLGISPLTDRGLEHLSGLVTLETLNLQITRITDAGLVHLKNLKALKKLALNQTRVSDAGLKHLDGLDNLEDLNLWDTQVKVQERPKKNKAP